MNREFPAEEERWMRHALMLAERAREGGEVPVGAVLVRGDDQVGEGWNRTIGLNDPSAHAEILALREAGGRLGNYRLPGCRLYVTLEPCAMCVGALVHARIERLVFGAPDPKTGALGGHFDLLETATHNHRIDVAGGCLGETCGELLRSFFRERRDGQGS